MDFQILVERVRGEFIEMPGLRLTPAQAERLWNVDASTCQQVIELLVTAAFLRWSSGGTVMRAERHGAPLVRTTPASVAS
jgi:hypothetical protein